MEVLTYSPKDVIVTFGGYVLEDWDSVSIRRNTSSFKLVNGIRGKNSRVRVNDTSALIEIELAQTSRANYIFQKIVEIDEREGTGRISMTIKDISGTELFSTNDAFIEGIADREYSADISSRRWRLTCMSSSHSGSDQVFSLEGIFNSIFN